MLDAAVKALAQLFSRPFRTVLLKAAVLTLVVYLIALPLVLFAGLGVIVFFIANAYLLGRIYFELAAMRFHPVTEAKRLRKTHQATAFTGGLFIAAFVSIPIVNL